MIKHFRNDCEGSSFSIQILEVFESNGYFSGSVCPIAREKRLEREEHWMKTLRNKYPYGLINDRAKGDDANKSVGLQFLSISRGAARTARPRTKPSIYNLI